MNELTGDEINQTVKKAQDGDNDAFETLYRQFGRPLYNTIARIVGDAETAEELVQELFLKTFRKIGSFNYRSSFYTWIYRIAVNMSLNHLKSQKSRRETQLQPEAWEAIPSGRKDDKDNVFLKQATLAAIQKVPPKQRAVLVMRIYDDMDYASIARTLGSSVGAAKANFHFAMQKLRNYMKDYR